MRTINKADLSLIIDGASWYAAGGAMPHHEQVRRLEMLEDNFSLPVMSLDEIDDNALVCCIYGVGPADTATIDLSQAYAACFTVASQYLGRTITAVFPAETGIEMAVIPIAAVLGIPVLDADTTGGRAVPELSIDNCALVDKMVTPVFVSDCNGNVSVIEHVSSFHELEVQVRAIAQAAPGGAIAALDHILEGKEAKDLLTKNILMRSRKLGQLLSTENLFENTIGDFIKIAEGTVKSVTLKSEAGFLTGSITIFSDVEEWKIFVKNEYLYARSSNGKEFSCPDLIVLASAGNKLGLHSTEISTGARVILYYQLAELRWRCPKARAMFGDFQKAAEDKIL